MFMVRLAAGMAALALAASPGLAAPKKGEPGYDPERQICKTRPVVGSRVQRVRECATAQQWEELKLQERTGLMRKQVNGSPGCRGCDSTRDTPW